MRFLVDASLSLVPAGFEADVIEGWGDLRLRWGGTEVSFAGEEMGWHVTFEGDVGQTEAYDFVAAVADQLSVATGEPCGWRRIT